MGPFHPFPDPRAGSESATPQTANANAANNNNGTNTNTTATNTTTGTKDEPPKDATGATPAPPVPMPWPPGGMNPAAFGRPPYFHPPPHMMGVRNWNDGRMFMYNPPPQMQQNPMHTSQAPPQAAAPATRGKRKSRSPPKGTIREPGRDKVSDNENEDHDEEDAAADSPQRASKKNGASPKKSRRGKAQEYDDNNDNDNNREYAETFPEKLHRLLIESESEGRGHIASFMPSGKSFRIYDRKTFLEEVAPLYFRIMKFSSFKRQLYLYDFQFVESGDEQGSYFHPYFLRDDPDALHKVRRVTKGFVARAMKKKTTQDGAGSN
jgi:hypothetical protein